MTTTNSGDWRCHHRTADEIAFVRDLAALRRWGTLRRLMLIYECRTEGREFPLAPGWTATWEGVGMEVDGYAVLDAIRAALRWAE